MRRCWTAAGSPIERRVSSVTPTPATRTKVAAKRVDSGPVLATATVSIDDDDSLDSLSAKMHAAEHQLLVTTLASLCRPPSLTKGPRA